MLITAIGSLGLMDLKQALLRVFHIDHKIAAAPTQIIDLFFLGKLLIQGPKKC
jgi:hypothetical protein